MNHRSDNYNPDALTCLANLSSDEVFTPPNLVNDMLDLLPAKLWRDPNARFLDPVTKTGIFLREMAKRLMHGLETKIPDKQKRINHIFSKQLYGIAITELTSLLSRRSVYCSKTANGKYSVCETFDNEQGNILYQRMQHIWVGEKCKYCGATKAVYDRGVEFETYAYNFIHTDKPEEIFNMKFDVIIGNPPYQLNDGGGTGSSAKPIYQLFIEQAKKLYPRYLTMIVPARWYSGGKGLDEFRNDMLNDKRIRKLIDYTDSRDCFPGVDIAGGVCYFLWDRDNEGVCEVTTNHHNHTSKSKRYLNEFNTFVRENIAIEIIRKAQMGNKLFLQSIVSSRMPFGIVSNVKPKKEGEFLLITSKGEGRISATEVTSGFDLINKWKVLLSKTASEHAGQADKEGRKKVFSRLEIISPGTVCSESYLIVGSYENEILAQNLLSYLKTKFCRFLVSTILLTQNITKGKFQFVPLEDFSEIWTDEKLYNKYGLTQDEIDFIETRIRPMDLNTNDETNE